MVICPKQGLPSHLTHTGPSHWLLLSWPWGQKLAQERGHSRGCALPHILTGTEGTQDVTALRNLSSGLSDQKCRNHKPKEKTKTEVFLIFFPSQ